MLVVSLAFFTLVALGSFFVLALGLPGNWMLLVGTLVAIAFSPNATLTWITTILFIALCVLADIVEWLCGVFGAKRYGVSGAGVWGSIIGGFVGALVGGAVVPIVGAVPGGFAGTFLGAFGVEFICRNNSQEALRLGYGAFVARMIALIAKVSVTLAMAIFGFSLLV